ncbi:LysM peptidoglycan-binding domain-containing protein [Kouleothrix sp.]|mgnify:CR=1 FL=1|uniref:LysM peptidoglycan-binding domain-containing protein n=1 Tax=Kouleothrix sp. TaxID=2779161 RepID=UPI00391AF074
MPQTVVYILLLFALVLPVLGAIALRLLGPRLTPVRFYGFAAGLLALVLISVLLLARADVPSLQIGSLSILLPVSSPGDAELNLPATPPAEDLATAPAAGATSLPAATPASLATAVLTSTATAAPTEVPTAAPTAAPTEVPTAVPTAAPTAAPPPAPSGQRKYTVQPGDTLRSIADQFKVSVKAIIDANRLTPAEADSLRVGQELVIP